MRVRAGLLGLVVILAGAAGCTSGRQGTAGTTAAVTTTTMHEHAAAPAPLGANASPREVRARFEQLLGQHALLAVRQMRSVVAPALELQQPAQAALQANTDALSKLVATAYGATQANRFTPIWQRHLVDLSSYAKAVGGHDTSAAQAARTALLADANAYGSWLAGASKGRVTAGDAAAAVRMHVQELMGQTDAYGAKDYTTAYRIEREAYEHMFTAGAALAKASVTPEVAVGFDAPPERLRSAFAMLLGEHMELIVDAQRATFAGAPEFDAAAAQVNANTATLAKALGGIVGPKKAAEFQNAWANHVEGLMAYTSAAANKDEAAKAAAKQNLDGFANRLALYFSDIVKNLLASDPLTQAITAHDQHLMDYADAYQAKDYARAEQMEMDGYQQMLDLADTLVGAIQKTVRPQLPAGGSQTGGGGTARRHP